jgi:hypothetical protein
MQTIPVEVRAYLSSNDSLVRAQLTQQHPDLDKTLNDLGTRTAVLNWLAGNEAWDESFTHFTMNCLRFLRSKANPSETQIIRAFLLHHHPHVRLTAYEFLLTLYFPDKNREALLQLLQNMLSDNHDAVRVEGARYVEQSGVVIELKDFLKRWYKAALDQGWNDTVSFELVERLLKD